MHQSTYRLCYSIIIMPVVFCFCGGINHTPCRRGHSERKAALVLFQAVMCSGTSEYQRVSPPHSLWDESDLFTAAPPSSGWGCLGRPWVLCSSWKADVRWMTVQMAQRHPATWTSPSRPTCTNTRGQNKTPADISSVKISPAILPVIFSFLLYFKYFYFPQQRRTNTLSQAESRHTGPPLSFSQNVIRPALRGLQ